MIDSKFYYYLKYFSNISNKRTSLEKDIYHAGKMIVPGWTYG